MLFIVLFCLPSEQVCVASICFQILLTLLSIQSYLFILIFMVKQNKEFKNFVMWSEWRGFCIFWLSECQSKLVHLVIMLFCFCKLPI
jgi:hypothetical protein